MTIKNFFRIILKIFGLFFIKEMLYIAPQLATFFLFLGKFARSQEEFGSYILIVLFLILYGFIAFLLLFKTHWIINKLKLDQGFDQELFTFDFSTQKTLTIALIIICGIIMLNEIPNLCMQVFSLLQVRRISAGSSKLDFSQLILPAVKILLALLIIGERKRIVKYIDNQ